MIKRFICIIFGMLVFLTLMQNYDCFAEEESKFSFSDLAVTPSIINPGEKVVLSCAITHKDSPSQIKLIAARVLNGKYITEHTMFYDDGTHGDITPDSGTYSLEIYAAGESGEEEIIFIAVDKDNNYLKSDPIILNVR